ncbi:CAP domain-containing protein [Oceanicola sp. D3]|uniref:CAP domain-containing protein n=1 Tax=Oceanicola sp. D3 TaxID=2587163 RepID=UPI00111DAD09|nr:CAP domain-containing protein [Oceanicola sp. D3]QDC08069.1 CAP domain-containing protein [Oceanicola sp. D3]
MHKAFRLAFGAMMTVASLSTTASGCIRGDVAGAENPINPARLDQPLLDAVIAVEVNYQRCQKGLPRLAGAAPLRDTAFGHANWMASKSTLSHKSTRPGRATVKARILASGLKVRRGSENIARVALYKVEGQRGYKISNAAQCKFTTPDGTPIGRHSYGSLARYTVALWMDSPDHRVNILARKYKMAASAIALDPRGKACGSLYIAQNFAG